MNSLSQFLDGSVSPDALTLADFPAKQGAFLVTDFADRASAGVTKLVSPGGFAAPLPVTNILETDHLSFRQFTELKADLDFLKERHA